MQTLWLNVYEATEKRVEIKIKSKVRENLLLFFHHQASAIAVHFAFLSFTKLEIFFLLSS